MKMFAKVSVSDFSTFRIKIKDSETKSNGETFYENSNAALIQRIHLTDSWRDDYIVEIEFTEKEFNSTSTFCRGISSLIRRKCNKFELLYSTA